MRSRTGSSTGSSTASFGIALLATAALSLGTAMAEDPNSAPNPYQATDNWAQLAQGRVWGQAIGVDIDRDGKSVWIFDRCGAKTCTGSQVAPIQKFDASGKLVTSFGAGMFNFPHGLFVDRDGNVWVSDGKAADGKGHTVVKFSPTGQVLMTLGTPGVAGTDEHHFNAPSDVAVAAERRHLRRRRSRRRHQRAHREVRQGRQVHQRLGPQGHRHRRVRDAARPRDGLRPAGSTSPTARTTACRSSTRTASSSPNGSSSAGRAACSSTGTT